MAPVVLVEHPVQDYDAWKQMFDSDPIGRRENGVERYTIYRSPEGDHLAVTLEFSSVARAAEFRAKLEERLRPVWDGLGATGPVARVLEEVERADV